MATTRNPLYSRAVRKTVDPCVPCPECGGLECLCRPRFYAGQLLTEQDLNRLDRYIVEKNKLHNRYLVGWGVACGLEVVCHPCGNYVLLKPGYALSPCGDDIIVCRDETVDVCKLINECCAPPEDPCRPPRPRPEGCDEATQDWILAICYYEAPSREEPVMKSSCATRCTCGGSGSGGCRCGGGKAKSGCGCSTKDQAAKPASRAPAQCEPTMMCEGYTFRVYPAPKQPAGVPPDRGIGLNAAVGGAAAKTSAGAMIDRMLACIQDLYASIPPAPANMQNVDTVRQWCCDVRDALLDVAAEHGVTNCESLSALRDLCPAPGQNQTSQDYVQQVTANLGQILKALLKECFCSALLPPCPGPQTDACVPLATITVRRKDCKILRICNLEGRKFLTTFPNLQYWLSFLPFTAAIRARLTRLCCGEVRFERQAVTGGERIFLGRRFTAPQRFASAFSAFTRVFTARKKVSVLDGLTFDVLGLSDENRQPFLSRDQAEDPISALLSEEVIGPLMTAAIPAGAAAGFANVAGFDAARFAGESQRRDEEVANLRAQMEELQKHIRTQQITIEGLAARMGPHDR